MAIIVKSTGADYTPCPAGTHLARCIQILELGTQAGNYQGKETHLLKVSLGFEVPAELDANGEPYIIYKDYTASLSEKANLRKDLEKWRNKDFSEAELAGFDVSKLLNIPCQIAVSHKVSTAGRTYAKLDGIMGIPKGMAIPAQHNKGFIYEIKDGAHGNWEKIPEWVRDAKKIADSPEWQQANEPKSAPRQMALADEDEGPNAETTDDLPF